MFLPHLATHNTERKDNLEENQWKARPRYSSENAAMWDTITSHVYKISGKNTNQTKKWRSSVFWLNDSQSNITL